MLAQLFNPTEIKKGPAIRPAIAPTWRSASPSRAGLAVLPATSQSYGAARVIVNGDHHRWWLFIPHESQQRCPAWQAGAPTVLGCALRWSSIPKVLRELGLTSHRVLGPTQLDDEWAIASNAQTGNQFRNPAAALLGVALTGSRECADLEPWRFRAAHRLRVGRLSGRQDSTPRYLRGLPALF